MAKHMSKAARKKRAIRVTLIIVIVIALLEQSSAIYKSR